MQPFGGKLESVRAFGPDGRRIPLAVRGGRLTPRTLLTPGETVSVEAVVRRPGWQGWALGSTRNVQRTIRAPVATVSERWLTVPSGSPVNVSFDRPVSAVAYGRLRRRALARPGRSLTLGRRAPAGTVAVAAAARPWERLGRPVTGQLVPARQLTGRCSAARRRARGSLRRLRSGSPSPSRSPTCSAAPARSSRRAHPAAGASRTATRSSSSRRASAPRFDSDLRVDLPRAVAVAGPAGSGLRTTSRIGWTVPPGSTLRLQQLLAQAGYLPLDWTPAGAPVARTPAAELQAAVDAADGPLQLALSEHAAASCRRSGSAGSRTRSRAAR